MLLALGFDKKQTFIGPKCNLFV